MDGTNYVGIIVEKLYDVDDTGFGKCRILQGDIVIPIKMDKFNADVFNAVGRNTFAIAAEFCSVNKKIFIKAFKVTAISSLLILTNYISFIGTLTQLPKNGIIKVRLMNNSNIELPIRIDHIPDTSLKCVSLDTVVAVQGSFISADVTKNNKTSKVVNIKANKIMIGDFE